MRKILLVALAAVAMVSCSEGIYILNYTNIYHYTIFSIVVYVNITNSFENYKLCFLPSSKLSINSLHSFLTSEDSKVILKSSISNLRSSRSSFTCL